MKSTDIEPPSYLVDEGRIVEEQDRTISVTPNLRDHVEIISAALDHIDKLLRAHPHSDEDELAVQRLAVRCFNSAAAGLRLVRCGYYQPSLTMVRDIIETTFLLDLFHRDRTAIREWRTLSDRDRERRFGPVHVRQRLNDLDGYKEDKRRETYRLFSTYASHPSPASFRIISPNNMTQIGPFPDARLLTAGLKELSQHLAYAAVVIGCHVSSIAPEILKTKARYLEKLDSWQKVYMPLPAS